MPEVDFSFEIAFYEALDRRSLYDGRVIELLAHLYTKAGRMEDGLAMDLRLSKIRPKDPMVHYNLACSMALVGQKEKSLKTLRKCIKMGYSDFEWMMQDSDLDSLHDLPEFLELIAVEGQ